MSTKYTAILFGYEYGYKSSCRNHCIAISEQLLSTCSKLRSSITGLPFHHRKSTTTFTKHSTHVVNQVVRLLPREKMPSFIPRLFVHDIALSPCPRTRQHSQLPRTVSQSQLDSSANILACPQPSHTCCRIIPIVYSLVIYTDVCGRSCGTEPVDAHPCAHLVWSPGVIVCPVVELFVNPGK